MAAYGIRIAPYHTWAALSILDETSKFEFHFQPPSSCWRSRSISRSAHSPCGEISNSLYRFYVLEIRADERFRDIPTPKLIGLGQRIRIRRRIEFFVGTHEKKVEVLLRPARSDPGPIFRLSFAERIRLHGDGLRPAPNEDIGFVSSRGSELAHRLCMTPSAAKVEPQQAMSTSSTRKRLFMGDSFHC
jgi:hypothetical protein